MEQRGAALGVQVSGGRRPVRLPHFTSGGATQVASPSALHATCAGRGLPPPRPAHGGRLWPGGRLPRFAQRYGRAGWAGQAVRRATSRGAHKELVCPVAGWVLSLILSICRTGTGATAQATREPWGNWCGIHALHWLGPLPTQVSRLDTGDPGS